MTRSGTKISTYLSSEARISMISPQIILRLTILHRSEIRPIPCYCSDEGVFGHALITLLAICQMNHRQSYFDIFMVSAIFPLTAMVVVIVLNGMFGTF